MPNSQKPLTGTASKPAYTAPTNSVTTTPAPESSQDVVASAASGEAFLTDLSPLTERTGQEILEELRGIRWLLTAAILEED